MTNREILDHALSWLIYGSALGLAVLLAIVAVRGF